MLFTLWKNSKIPITFLTIAISFIFILTNSGFGQSDNVMDKNEKVYKMFSDKEMDKNRKGFPDEQSILDWFAKWSKNDQSIDGAVDHMIGVFKIFAKRAAEMKSTKIRDAIMNFPELDHVHYIASGKIIALGYFMMDMPGVKDYIIVGLSSEFEVVQRAAVKRLMNYGYDWRELEPIVAKYEMFSAVGQNEVKEAIPLLRKALINGSWEGRIRAGHALDAFGFHEALVQAATDVLQNAPVSDDVSVRRAVLFSLKVAEQDHLTHLIPDISRFAASNNILVYEDTADLLMTYVVEDRSLEAEKELRRLLTESKNENLKQRIKSFLDEKASQEK